jgi:glyoxalase family protein
VPLSLAGYEKLAALLTDLLGFREVVAEANSFRYAVGEGGPGTQVDRRWKPGFWPGTVGASSVHPVGRRVPDAQAQGALFRVLVDEQFDVSPVLDQRYFCFAYFRESSRTRVEIATDPPGFAVDEEEAAGLGERPVLSPWPEQMRLRIEERSARQFARETGA